jgi:hypothetical protein
LQVEGLQDRGWVYEQAVRTWAETDLGAASEWAADLPEGEERDQAAAGLIEIAKFAEPDSAFEWGQAIADPEARREALASVFRTWQAIDEDRALEAYESLAEEDREPLKKLFEP